jgi:two-component system cell cycle response regulator
MNASIRRQVERSKRRFKKQTVMKILLAEDSRVYRHLIVNCLEEWNFPYVVAKDGTEAWRCLESEWAPTLALLDWVLPGMSGLELCQRIRARTHNEQYVYTIVLTAKNQKRDLLEALEAGADDYLSKPFDPLELKARLLAGKRIILLQRELIAARESLRFAATHDSLTGLLNRGEIIAFLRRQIARSRREGSSVGIVLADLDHFKKINDTFGHSAGDAVLQESSRRFRTMLRVYDGVGRYGGEEFLLILTGCDLEATVRRADAIRRNLTTEPMITSQGSVSATVSMGVTVANPTSDISVEALLERADEALYRAKAAGRDRVETDLRIAAWAEQPPALG